MGRRVDIPWVGGVNIPRIGVGSIYHGYPIPMVYQTHSYGIMNSSLLVEMRGGSV
jgi:hypothetical protein